jgi:hypothetical protein
MTLEPHDCPQKTPDDKTRNIVICRSPEDGRWTMWVNGAVRYIDYCPQCGEKL